jgi:hypothetical protein
MMFIWYSNCLYKTSQRPSWSWLHGSWIYNYLCNQCLSPVCPWLAAGWRFPSGTPLSIIIKTYLHDITEILLKVVLNTITLTQIPYKTTHSIENQYFLISNFIFDIKFLSIQDSWLKRFMCHFSPILCSICRKLLVISWVKLLSYLFKKWQMIILNSYNK